MKNIILKVAKEFYTRTSVYTPNAEMFDIQYDEEKNTLYFCIQYKGWYAREKVIDILYNHFSFGAFEIDTDPYKITLRKRTKVYKEPYHMCNVSIKWVNTLENEKIPEIMKNLLSGVSYEEYKNF